MEKVKLDLKDKRILDALDQNANLSIAKLSKSVGISRQVAQYRIKKLLSQGTIYNFFTLIDPGRLGYTLFRVHMKLENIPEDSYVKFAKTLFESYPTFWVAFISGSFDIIADIWARNSNEFEALFNKLLNENKNIINSYEINPMLELDLYPYNYFLKDRYGRKKTILFRNTGEIKIDKTDKKILQTIKKNSRFSYEEIGRRVGLTRNAIKKRILKLEEKGVIEGYKMMVDFKQFNKLSYKIFVKYDNSKISQEKDLLTFIGRRKGILATAKHLGRWNLDIEIEPVDAKDLQKFIIELRNKFEIIEDYEIIQILDDYGIDFYPNKID